MFDALMCRGRNLLDDKVCYRLSNEDRKAVPLNAERTRRT